ncbi:MAG TPA: NAD(P)/FAD-dependent oxidoreductase [Candidatus Thermoplasmatota archaeon]|nr:NAD(P)/FAD-dependent oxidoreductase [Candidatus Thermoplasmatota archaeon]
MDVRIIGGGFAGVVTALTLMERVPLAHVTIYEREPSAHTTLCGEGLSADTLRAFTAFDSAPYVAETFEQASWSFPGGTEFRIHQRGHTMARERWIPAMAQAVKERGGTYVTGAKIGLDEVARMAGEADVVVGADGPGSVTRKHVGGTHETMLGIQYRVAREGRVPDRLEFYTDKAYSPEYAWVFPRGDIMNVGLLATGDGEDWARLDRFMKDKRIDAKILKREAYPIGFFGTKVQRDNVVLVGDAAGLTNPITKGGMSAVVYAADVLARCIAEDRLAEYEGRIRAHPMCDASFGPALAAMRRWSNADYASLLRFAPKSVDVVPGRSTERRHALRLGASLLANPREVRAMMHVARALGVSRAYSW